MIDIATFPSAEEGHMFRAFLDSRGIEGFVQGEFTCQNFLVTTMAFSGVRVQVADDDGEAAAVLYGEYLTALRSGPLPESTVCAWPWVAMITLLKRLPQMLFGHGPRTWRPGKTSDLGRGSGDPR